MAFFHVSLNDRCFSGSFIADHYNFDNVLFLWIKMWWDLCVLSFLFCIRFRCLRGLRFGYIECWQWTIENLHKFNENTLDVLQCILCSVNVWSILVYQYRSYRTFQNVRKIQALHNNLRFRPFVYQSQHLFLNQSNEYKQFVQWSENCSTHLID